MNLITAGWAKLADQIAEHLRAAEGYPALWKVRELEVTLQNWADKNPPRVEDVPEDEL
jgi:hypothetical protein